MASLRQPPLLRSDMRLCAGVASPHLGA